MTKVGRPRGKIKILPVDKDKLKQCLQKHNTSFVRASTEMGWSRTYIDNSIREYGGVNKATATSLKLMYGIDYDEYKPDEKPEPIEETVITETPQKSDDLKQLELEIQTLRREHYAMDITMQNLLKTVKALEETVMRTYNNSVETRECVNRTWQDIAGITEAVAKIGNVKSTITETSCRTKEILNRLKGMQK